MRLTLPLGARCSPSALAPVQTISFFGASVRHVRLSSCTSRPALSFNAGLDALLHDAEAGRLRAPRTISSAQAPRKDVLLLHPPGSCSQFTRSGSLYPPLGLNLLKALIGDAQSVDVLEADGSGLSNEETLAELRAAAPLAVGLTITCGTKRIVGVWAAAAKRMHEDCTEPPIVIVGGPSVAFEAADILRDCPEVDVAVKGEGEVTFPRIVAAIREAANQTPGSHSAISASNRSTLFATLAELPGVVVRGAAPRLNDFTIPTLPQSAFATLPFPDLSSAPVHRYWAPDARGMTPLVTMMSQRGCQGKCGFCNTPQIHGQQMRGWSNEQIVAELAQLKARHGIRTVSFVDDVFTNRPGGGPRRLCELMISAELELSWYCNARADGVSPRIAAAMRAAGCFQVFIGFESGCDDMLSRIGKGETVAQLERGAAIMKEAGISLSIGFIVGLPGETQASVDKSIALCNRVRPDRAQFTRYTPIKGSPLAASHGQLVATSAGFHDRGSDDRVEGWLRQCYAECPYAPSV